MPSVVRLLVPIVAVLALLGQPLTAWSAAGWQGDTKCCCPDPKRCECHDHEGKAPAESQLKRCGSGAVHLVAPVIVVSVVPPAAPAHIEPRAVAAPAAAPIPIPDSRIVHPVTPPF